MSIYHVRCGDTKPLEVVLTDERGRPLNLTGATINFMLKKPGATSLIERPVQVTAADKGEVLIPREASDFDAPGHYFAAFEVGYPDQSEETVPTVEDMEIIAHARLKAGGG
ncbi:MAG TPA: BppU family phage baseplate upper protein [Firmicutes bacterium]|nr:BppU family phage baseplate upper protein [Candidatus Fermentithermobacillaceae bacterium]